MCDVRQRFVMSNVRCVMCDVWQRFVMGDVRCVMCGSAL
jgi:hypothetical protein